MINSTSLASNKCSKRTTLTIPGKWYSNRAMPQQVQVTHRCREVAPGSVAVVAIEVTILDLLMATILREVEREEVAKAASDLPEAATPLPKSD